MKIKIKGTGSAVPKLRVTNDDLSKLMDTSDEWIRSRTGIGARHLAVEETTTGLAVAAAKEALKDAGMTAEELDLIIAATVTADKFLPNLSCEVQSALGAENAVAFDLNAACSGFLFALNTVQMYLENGVYKKALVIGAETLSKIMDWNDRSTCVLFGDGAGAAVVAVKPNCSIQSYAPVLTAWKEFEPYEVVATTYQAISGAGKTFKDWPEMVGNIIPYIGGEEEKSEKEPLRIWGHVDAEKKAIVPAESPVITCQCIRVPVLNGHTAAVFVKFKKNPTKEQLIEALKNFSGVPQELGLPSAPKQFIQYLEEDNRPQVSLDVNYENGMGISVGRLREDTVYDWKFVGLSHNTVRGAAGGAVLCAELLKAQGYITKKL